MASATTSTSATDPTSCKYTKYKTTGRSGTGATGYFDRPRGSDPRAATCRSKLQSKRAKLNQEINKELRLRAGAENLFKATSNKKLRETVSLELSFVNSNLQLLKEQLAVLNSSVEVYQGDQHGGLTHHIPMIPLGLKETKEVPFHDALHEFIEDHYKGKADEYLEAIAELSDLRQAMRTPSRDATGIGLLYEYYNQLYFFERRFFSPERGLGVFFDWFDSLTGVPSAQRTVAFEKACVLFNLGALHTQIGTRLERGTGDGLDGSVDNFLRAAAVFRFIVDNFTNAPSMDLAPQVLEAFILLMIAQARECLFEKLLLSYRGESAPAQDIDAYLEQAQEAAELSESYQRVYEALSIELVKDYVPDSWIALVQVKSQYYEATAHQMVGSGLVASIDGRPLSLKTKETLTFMYTEDERASGGDANASSTSNLNFSASKASKDKVSTIIDIRVPKNGAEQLQLGLSHMRESVLLHEESLRLQRMCRDLKKRDHLSTFLRRAHDAALSAYTRALGDDEFGEALDPPPILASTKLQLSFGQPDFGQHPVDDLFRGLGPLTLFSAKHKWNPPRLANLRKLHDQGFGFSVRGDGPIIIAGVDGGSIADLAGVREGDVIIGIGDVDVKWSTHEEVVSLIKNARNDLSLKLIQPVEKPNQPSKSMMKSMAKTLPGGRGSTSPTSTTSSSSGVSSAASHSLSSTLAGRSSSSKNNSKSCDRIHAIGRNLPGVRRRDKSLDSHVKYRTDAKSSSKGGRSRDRTITGRLSLAADFFNLSLHSNKDRDRTVDSGTSSQARSTTAGSRLTWNPFRTKSRERQNNHSHSLHQQSHHMMALKTPATTPGSGEVICKNIIMR
ncbi:rhophilin-2-like isoform X1 [Daphnia pulicaria]|uniref:rhophilin-2-like isoform X1 n=1 Tax=Daphnia pulicaria TaxID=35523 RepID=UPI001EEA91B1|nr:rhophilin-2-like isoform X1 [Daphnia pulicaria]XP_046646787.1 rhophilin-2-like isoform X1 [Daphnia pulicaria]XP_046646788.1 rhophilin-2-like isoform X1 [Daphnia pulicaria]